MRLVPGLLGNPQSASLCTREQLRSDAGCPASARVGTVRVTRAVKPKLGKGARQVRIVWSGLKRAKGKKVRRTLVVPVVIKDARGETTTLRLRVRRD